MGGCVASKANCAEVQHSVSSRAAPAQSVADGAIAKTLLANQPSTKTAALVAATSQSTNNDGAAKQTTICQEAIDLKEAIQDDDKLEEAVAARRSNQRKGTPWINPGDAQLPVDDDEEEDDEREAGSSKRAKICQEAIDHKEVLEEPMAAKRSSARKSTPWIKPGDAKLSADEEEEDEPSLESSKRATICQEAIDRKEDREEPIAAKRSSARKSTPWIKPGDAKPLDHDAEADEEADAVSTKRAAICQEAIDLKTSSGDSAETMSVTRSRQRKSTPWIKPGDALPMVDGEHDEDDEEQGEHGSKRATICQQAIQLKRASEAAEVEDTVPVNRSRQRKSTPWIKLGDAEPLDDESEDDFEAALHAETPAQRASIRSEIEVQQVPVILAEGDGNVVDAETVRRCRQRKSTPWVKPGDYKPLVEVEQSHIPPWMFFTCCAQDNRLANKDGVSACDESP